jgi:hypothetical protein
MPSPNLQTTGVDLSPTSPDGVQSTRRDTMNTVSPDVPSSRIIMFGLRCDFTEAVATGLTERGIPPAALLVPGHPQLERPVRVGAPPSALPIAGMPRPRPGSTYPTFQIGQIRASPTIDLIESLQPDVIVVACYPRLIPRMIREIPRLGSLNVHPSLLPAHRGPDPLFWIMRDGGDGCGVTVHELSDAFDAGDILAQQAVPYPDGSRERELELLLASVGAELSRQTGPETRFVSGRTNDRHRTSRGPPSTISPSRSTDRRVMPGTSSEASQVAVYRYGSLMAQPSCSFRTLLRSFREAFRRSQRTLATSSSRSVMVGSWR